VGAAKSGTTALHYFLRQHPQIYMPLKKEIHHFAPDLLQTDDVWLDRNKYLSLFNNARPGQVIGETSALHLLSEKAAEKISEFDPDAKIIILLRNPIEVTHAHHTQLVYNGEETIIDFEETLKAEDERKKGMNLPPNTRIQKKHLPVHSVLFAGQIERFIKIFRKEQIYIFLHDDFKLNPVSEVQKLYLFLQVDDSFVPKLKIVNAAKQIRSRCLQKLFKLFSDKVLNRFLETDTIEALRLWVEKCNSKNIKRKELKPETKTILIKQLKPEIEKLSILLNRDLSHWTN